MKQFRKITIATFITSVAALTFSCEKPQDEPGTTVPLELSVEVSEITETSAKYTVTANSQDSTYLSGIATREEYASFASAAEFVSSRLDDIRSQAEAEGTGYLEYLSGVLCKGDGTYTADTLRAGTAYVAFAAGITAGGNAGSLTVTEEFTTEGEAQEQGLFTFEPVFLSDLAVNINVTPDTKLGWYFFKTVDQSVLDWAYGGLETLQEMMEDEFIYNIELLMTNSQYTLQQAISSICWKGKQVFPVRKMVPETTHYMLAVGIDENSGRFMTDVYYDTYESGKGGSLDGFSIDFNIGDVVINSVEVRTTPSADDVRYYFDRTQLHIPDEDILDYLYGNIQDLIDLGIVADANGYFAQWCSVGSDMFTYTNLEKGTYRIYGFGIGNDGQPATETMFSEPFTVTM